MFEPRHRRSGGSSANRWLIVAGAGLVILAFVARMLLDIGHTKVSDLAAVMRPDTTAAPGSGGRGGNGDGDTVPAIDGHAEPTAGATPASALPAGGATADAEREAGRAPTANAAADTRCRSARSVRRPTPQS